MRPPLLLLAILGAVAAACGGTPPPGRPAWDQDVLPLLQGRCNHCHGETVGHTVDAMGMPVLVPVTRLDFCDAGAAPIRDIGVGVLGGALAILPGFFGMQLEPDKKTGRALMPPPPAQPLSEYEYQVLKRWVKIVAADPTQACLKAVKNRAPKLELIAAPKEAGEVVEAIVEITDVDGDSVVGKATLGSASVDILGAGRRILRFPKGTPASATLGVVVTDGYDTTRL
jgi:hypothetical protein